MAKMKEVIFEYSVRNNQVKTFLCIVLQMKKDFVQITSAKKWPVKIELHIKLFQEAILHITHPELMLDQ